MSLGSVFHNLEPVSARQLQDRVHVGRLTIEMDWDDCFRLRCDLCLNLADIDVVGLRIDVAKNDLRAGRGDCFRRCNEAVRRCNYLIAYPNAKTLERDEQGIGPVAYTDTMFDLTKPSKSLFESPDIGASNKGGCGNDLLNGCIDFIFDALV